MEKLSETCKSTSLNVTQLAIKREKGKRMWEARCRTKDLENQLKAIENRISHFQGEQMKIEKQAKLSEKNSINRALVREQYEKFKQEKIEWRLNSDHTVDSRRHSLKKVKKERTQSIKNALEQVQRNNHVSFICAKVQQKANDAFLEKFTEFRRSELKNQANDVKKFELMNRHKRSVSSQQVIMSKETEYSEKLQKELEVQENIQKKIEELSRMQEDITRKMLSEENRKTHSACAFFSEKSISQDKETNITSIV